MGKSCWTWQSHSIQQHLPIQILLIFLKIKLLQNLYLNATDLKLGSLLIFSCSIHFLYSHLVPGLKLRVGRSLYQVLQRAHCKTMHVRFDCEYHTCILVCLLPLFCKGLSVLMLCAPTYCYHYCYYYYYHYHYYYHY